MMHPSCLLKVEQYIQSEVDEVKSIVRNLCVLNSTDWRIDNLVKQHAPLEDEEDLSDCRIAKLVFRNFRTYPKTEYGLLFSAGKGSYAASLFLVGQNGSGKSTIYTALEKIYTGTSSYANQMAKDKEDEYLTFGFQQMPTTSDRSWSLEYVLADATQGTLNMSDKKSVPLAVPAFFCSDVDIVKMKSQQSLFDWILEQMGFAQLEDMVNCVEQLRQEQLKLQEHLKDENYLLPSDYDDLMLAILDYSKGNLGEIIENKDNLSSNDTTHHFFSDKWKELNTLQKEKSNGQDKGEEGGLMDPKNTQFDDSQIKQKRKKLSFLYEKLFSKVKGKTGKKWKIEALHNLRNEQIEAENWEKKPFSKESLEKITKYVNTLEQVLGVLTHLQQDLVKDFVAKYGDHVKQILSKFSNHGEKYDFQNIDDRENFSLDIRVKLRGNYHTSPYQYFNEFRFKLYCVTMKIAIAFYWMQVCHEAAPIVIDDVFNANDFENSLKLERYAYFLKKTYNDMVLNKGFEKELQIILLSHDDLVIKSFYQGYKGLNYVDMATMRMDKFPVVKGRLYRLEEIDEYYSLKNEEGSFDYEQYKIKSIYQCLK